jgi:hypothetical protein
LRILVLLAVLLVGLGAAQASAAPRDVVADYFADGIIDGTYPVADLHAALAIAQRSQELGQGPQYGAFAEAVTQKITEQLAGTARDSAERQLTRERNQQELPPPPAPSDPNLPSPPTASPGDAAPWALVVAAVLAGLLATAGGASAAYRRIRR